MKTEFTKYARRNFWMIEGLHENVRPLFREFLIRLAMAGVTGRIPDDGGMRSATLQKELYYRVPPVTWVLCPNSMHCHGLAIDFLTLRKIGPIEYEYKTSNKLFVKWMDEQYEIAAKIAMQLGIKWGYQLWGVDKPHFHYDGGLGLAPIAGGAPVPVPEFIPCFKPPPVMRALERMEVPLDGLV